MNSYNEITSLANTETTGEMLCNRECTHLYIPFSNTNRVPRALLLRDSVFGASIM